jgi:hypothetical protein
MQVFYVSSLEYELASLYVSVFALQEDPWEYGFAWCIGL